MVAGRGVFKSLLNQRIVFFQSWNSLLILATSMGRTSLRALRLIWGTRRKKDKQQMKHAHTKLGKYVTVFFTIFIDTKIENSDTANLKASTCDTAVCMWIVSRNISIHPLSWNHPP